jgi:transposase-like protein
MELTAFNEIINNISKMDNLQKQRLYAALKNIVEPPLSPTGHLIDELRETKFKDGLECPHCHSKHVIRFGKYNERQRYRCKECKKTFIDLTSTPLNRTRYPDKWIKFIECMIKGYSLRKSAEIVGVSWVTLFYWRYKILSALNQLSISQFEGIVEVDETYMLYSEKGKRHIENRKSRKRGGVSKFRGISHEQVCVLVARDREKNTVAKVSCMGRILKSQVDKTIGHMVSNENILCTDAWRAYMTYAKEKNIQHYRIKSDGKSHVIKGIYHIQNVNSYHQRFKKWMDRFNGVASKYLNNYLAWFKFLDMKGHEDNITNLKDMLITSCLYQVNETYNSLRLAKFSI